MSKKTRLTARVLMAGVLALPLLAGAQLNSSCTRENAGECLAQARAALMRGAEGPDLDAVNRLLEAACTAENADACLLVASHYDRGVGYKKNAAQAAKFLERSCELDPAGLACYTLYENFQFGHGGFAIDTARAAKYLEKGVAAQGGAALMTAADEAFKSGRKPLGERLLAQGFERLSERCRAGNAQSCTIEAYALATRNNPAHFTPEQKKRFIESSTAACEANSALGCGLLGYYKTVNANETESGLELLEKACKAHDGRSCGFLADQLEGREESIDTFDRVEKLISRSCAFEVSGACERAKTYAAKNASEITCARGSAADCFVSGRKALDEGQQGHHKAAAFFEKACTYNSGAGCNALGQMYREGRGFARNTQTANTYFQKACTNSDGAGCYNLALSFEAGEGLEKSNFRARDNFKRACELNHADSCASLALLYEEGRAVRQDYARAKELYGKACDAESNTGCAGYARLDAMDDAQWAAARKAKGGRK